uniref:Uncharacterized protein n=1 Tax=Arundo donax TaxID=35708 RepID=A0A0A8Y4P9_ARUDO
MSGKSQQSSAELKTKWLPLHTSHLLPFRLEFIKDLNLKLEPTSTQRRKSTKIGSQPIQGRSEQR